MLHLTFSNFPKHWQILFQKPATTMMEGIIDLHHDIMAFLVIILIFVSFMLLTIFIRYSQKKGISLAFMKFHKGHGITHDTVLETIWTIIPTIILLLIATPSFALVYALDEIVEPQLTVRVAGRQWYWTYEFPDTLVVRHAIFSELASQETDVTNYTPVLENIFEIETAKRSVLPVDQVTAFLSQYENLLTSNIIDDLENVVDANFFEERLPKIPITILLEYPGFSFDSYLVPTEDLLPGAFRLLEVDRRLVLPANTNIRLLITAYDVLHSWAVPAFGVKVDAVPGRLNEYFLNVKYHGLFYGQCSEICGVNHAFMPIKVEITSLELFSQWFSINSVLEAPTFKFVNFLHTETNFNDFWEIYQLGVVDKDELKTLFLDYCLANKNEIELEKIMYNMLSFNYDLDEELLNLLIQTKLVTFFDFDQLVDLVIKRFCIENNVEFGGFNREFNTESNVFLLKKVCESCDFTVDYFLNHEIIFSIFTSDLCEILLDYMETLPDSEYQDFIMDLFDLFDDLDRLDLLANEIDD